MNRTWEVPFQPGDHLRVRRHAGYYHHGIYAGEGTVVQFGGRVVDKPDAKIEEVPLSSFERDGTAERVDHSQLRWPVAGWKLPPALPPERIVARARCLARQGVQGAYNLFGNNCETVALWCVAGFGESLQRQTLNKWKIWVGAGLGLVLAAASRRETMQTLLPWIAGAVGILSLAETTMYLANNRRFYLNAKPCNQV